MTQLLAIDATQIVLIVFIALLVIAYPILISSRNKKENQKLQYDINQTKTIKFFWFLFLLQVFRQILLNLALFCSHYLCHE